MSHRSRAARPVLEALEGRALMSTSEGGHFAFGSRITWSIEPDGTNLGGTISNLNTTLNARFGSGNWLRAIQDAFAVWENVANINAVQVSDDGSALNAGSLQQGSPSFGDIRIGGFSLDPSVLGFTLLPPPFNGGSDSSDIVLNSNQSWQIGNDYDLESVMIHEIGHALGLGHSADSTASMYAYYHGTQQCVSTDDINGIQSIWSPRQEDGFAVGNQNFAPTQAVDLTQYTGPTGQVIAGPLNVVKPSETYWFKVTTPSNASNAFQAVVQSANLSELSPRVTIYDSGLHGLWAASAPANSYGSFVNATIYNATPNTTYYIRVGASTAGSTGSGAYALLINMGTQNLPAFAPPNTQVAARADQGGGASQELNNVLDSSGLANPPGSSRTSAIIGPVSLAVTGSGDPVGVGVSDVVVKPGGPGLLAGLGAWESIHGINWSVHTSGGTTVSDVPDTLSIGNATFRGDFFMTTPPPGSILAPDPSPSVTAGALIPLDPTAALGIPATSAARKDAAAILLNAYHPRGPF